MREPSKALVRTLMGERRYHDSLRLLGAFRGTHSVSYSQQAEDLHLERFFGAKRNGFYVDVGAFHPIQYSNTFLFYQRGWRGINIEPNPDQFRFFKTCRPRDINLNIAVGSSDSHLTYYCFDRPALNSFSKEHADAWASKPGIQLKRTIEVDTVPLDAIFSRHLPAGVPIDFLDVDAEGWDLKVLESNNWQCYRPTLVLTEVPIEATRAPCEEPIVAYLASVGYKLWCITGGTAIFHDQRKGI